MAGRPKKRASAEKLKEQPSGRVPADGKVTEEQEIKPYGPTVDIDRIPNPKSQLQKIELAHKALTLRKVGYDYVQIARLMGLEGPRAAELLVHRMLKGGLRGETVEEIRQLDLSRLDRYESILNDFMDQYPKMSVRAIEVAMQVMKRRADLTGMDSPTKHEIDSTKTTVVEYVRDPTQDDHKRKVAEIIDAEYEDLPQLEESLRGLPEHSEADDQASGSPDPGDTQ